MEERDSRSAAVDRDILPAQQVLTRSSPGALSDLDALIGAFAPLVEWEYLSREQKRSVLATIVPDIRVADKSRRSALARQFSATRIPVYAGGWTFPKAREAIAQARPRWVGQRGYGRSANGPHIRQRSTRYGAYRSVRDGRNVGSKVDRFVFVA